MYFEGNRMSVSITATTPSIFRHTVCPAVSTRRTRVVLVQILVGEVSTAATRLHPLSYEYHKQPQSPWSPPRKLPW